MTDVIDIYDDSSVIPMTAGAGSGVGRLEKAARARDDISGELTQAQIAQIGRDVVDDWQRDLASNKDWREKAEAALDAAAQETPETKTYPFAGAANVRYPLLTIASIAFGSRAVPAIIKDDQAVKFKVLGKDTRGEKRARAERMADYHNWKLFYDVEGWEQDTDALLHRLPIVGQGYRKVYFDPLEGRTCIESVSALRLTIPADAVSLKTSPRITHDFDRYPYQLKTLMRQGFYREVDLIPAGEDDQGLRVILEQHRMMDLDDDGLDEPYIVTVDQITAEVLRIEEAFEEDDIALAEDGGILRIKRWQPFVDYGFIPDPKGRAYNIGFGHLLTQIMSVIDTAINMQIDAGHAQVAGGGFISQEIRLQGAGQTGRLTFQPGEYKTVAASAGELRNAIYERTFPGPSDVLFQLLGLLMEAAKDIASVNDAITGDAARTAPVGTTLALIEQGQQVFNAIYKRIYRALREEFKLFSDCLRRYADPAEYAEFCDVEPEMMGHNGGPPMGGAEPGAVPEMGNPITEQVQGLIQPQGPVSAPIDPAELFRADFDEQGLDIRPISDPGAVTKMQQVAKDQIALSFLGKGIYADDRLVVRQTLLNVGIEQADEWIPDQAPPMSPVQVQMAALEAALQDAMAKKALAEAEKAAAESQLKIAQAAQIANESTGPQADVKLAKDASTARLQDVKAAETAQRMVQPAPTGQGGER